MTKSIHRKPIVAGTKRWENMKRNLQMSLTRMIEEIENNGGRLTECDFEYEAALIRDFEEPVVGDRRYKFSMEVYVDGGGGEFTK